MSLTADQITAQNFKDFYGQIRPYLNGQVPTFANQFSRSDLYSTSEKIVGSWKDGKPLYQKTIECEALPNNTTKSVAHGVSNLDKIVDIKGCAYRSSDGLFVSLPRVATSTTYMCEINVKSGNVNITSSTDLSAFGWSYVTIQYTKTTDSAIKVGTGTDYSTDEQIIGSWIDGKPLYQKTFSGTVSSANNISYVSIGASVDTFVDGRGVLDNSVPLIGVTSESVSAGVSTFVNSNSAASNKNTFGVYSKPESQSAWVGKSYYLTLCYTKTTD